MLSERRTISLASGPRLPIAVVPATIVVAVGSLPRSPSGESRPAVLEHVNAVGNVTCRYAADGQLHDELIGTRRTNRAGSVSTIQRRFSPGESAPDAAHCRSVCRSSADICRRRGCEREGCLRRERLERPDHLSSTGASAGGAIGGSGGGSAGHRRAAASAASSDDGSRRGWPAGGASPRRAERRCPCAAGSIAGGEGAGRSGARGSSCAGSRSRRRACAACAGPSAAALVWK